MLVTTHFKELGESLLESADGCDQRTFNSYIKLVRFFGYENLALTIMHNSVQTWEGSRKKIKCQQGMIHAIFKEMGV